MLKSSRFKFIVTGAVFFVILVVAVHVILSHFRANAAVAEIHELWNEANGTREEFVDKHHRESATPGALELESRARALGIDLVPSWVEDRARPSHELLIRALTFELVFSRYFDSLKSRTTYGSLPSPKEELATHLADNDTAWVAVREALTSSDEIRWESDPSTLWTNSFAKDSFDALRLIELHRMLANGALVRSFQGDREGAIADVNAAWQIVQITEASPFFETSILRKVLLLHQLQLVRLFPNPPTDWLQRVRATRYRDALIDAAINEGRATLDLLTQSQYEPEKISFAGFLSDTFMWPRERMAAARASWRWSNNVTQLRDAGPACDGGYKELGVELDFVADTPGFITQFYFDAINEQIKWLGFMEYQLELTERVLEASTHRKQRDLTASDDQRERIESRACPGAFWIYDFQDDSLVIELSRTLDWPVPMPPGPTRVELQVGR